jgi:hypothetical protein
MLVGLNKMPVRLINTTTRLPVDKRLEDELFCIMEPELKDVLWKLYVPFWQGDAPIDIFLVNELSKNKIDYFAIPNDEEKSDFQNTDYLGMYYPHHPKYPRPAIEISPERIMETANEVCQKAPKNMNRSRAYPALFCMVAVHELAHALMDNSESINVNISHGIFWHLD